MKRTQVRYLKYRSSSSCCPRRKSRQNVHITKAVADAHFLAILIVLVLFRLPSRRADCRRVKVGTHTTLHYTTLATGHICDRRQILSSADRIEDLQAVDTCRSSILFISSSTVLSWSKEISYPSRCPLRCTQHTFSGASGRVCAIKCEAQTRANAQVHRVRVEHQLAASLA